MLAWTQLTYEECLEGMFQLIPDRKKRTPQDVAAMSVDEYLDTVLATVLAINSEDDAFRSLWGASSETWLALFDECTLMSDACRMLATESKKVLFERSGLELSQEIYRYYSQSLGKNLELPGIDEPLNELDPAVLLFVVGSLWRSAQFQYTKLIFTGYRLETKLLVRWWAGITFFALSIVLFLSSEAVLSIVTVAGVECGYISIFIMAATDWKYYLSRVSVDGCATLRDVAEMFCGDFEVSSLSE